MLKWMRSSLRKIRLRGIERNLRREMPKDDSSQGIMKKEKWLDSCLERIKPEDAELLPVLIETLNKNDNCPLSFYCAYSEYDFIGNSIAVKLASVLQAAKPDMSAWLSGKDEKSKHSICVALGFVDAASAAWALDILLRALDCGGAKLQKTIAEALWRGNYRTAIDERLRAADDGAGRKCLEKAMKLIGDIDYEEEVFRAGDSAYYRGFD